MSDGVIINTGTGVTVGAELVGTQYLQRVKLVLGAVDTDSGDVSVSNMLPITGTGLTIASMATGTVNVVNVISASNVTVASVATGTMNVVNVLSASNVTVASVATGTMNVVNTVTVTAANVTVASVATGTMNVVNVLSASNVTIASVTTGTMNVVNTVAISGTVSANVLSLTGSSVYTVAGTALGTTGQGLLIMGIQSGSTAAQPFAITTTGAIYAAFAGTQAVTAANVTVASVTTGTMNVINVLSASNVTVASVATGTFSMSGTGNVTIAGTPAVTGNIIIVTTTKGVAGGIVSTVHASQFQAFVLATTSAAAGVIVKTSGANTIYITDILVGAAGALTVGLYSETTGPLGQVFLAANGGWVQDLVQPYICTSAQSLRVILSSSGSCAVSVIGYTVT